MPILPPGLDDRRFDDLVEDLIARIPAHTPEWTNPRLGDPGRTLIELFAWLGDTLLYRANLIPERQRLAFLSLLGIGLKPARAATGIVSLSYAQPTERRAITLRPGARVNGPVPFETLGETTVLPISGEAYIKRALTRRRGHAGRRADRRSRPHSRDQRFGQGLPDHAGLRRGARGAGRHRRVRGERRPRVVDRAARPRSAAAGPAADRQRGRPRRARRRRHRRARR